MTYTILGRCQKTGRLGIGIATFSITVGRYCYGIRSREGMTVSQAFPNEGNNQLALRLLSQGFAAPSVLEQLKANDPDFDHRQIGVIDRDGTAVGYTGPGYRGWAGHLTGENFVACGNGLVNAGVVEAIAQGFLAEPDADLEHRLLMGIEAGRDAGGQGTAARPKTERSSALIVYSTQTYSDIDVRVDLHEKAIDELRRVYTEYKKYEGYYAARSRNPRDALSQEQFMATLQQAAQ